MRIYDGFSGSKRCLKSLYAREDRVAGEKDSISPFWGARESDSRCQACREGCILDGERRRRGAAGTSRMQYARLRMPISMLRIRVSGGSLGMDERAWPMRWARMGFVPEVWRPHF